jgi:hypothetical protein
MLYEYGWVSRHAYTGPCFTQCSLAPGNLTYICVNCPQVAIERYVRTLEKDPLSAYRFGFLDMLSIAACLETLRKGIDERHKRLKTYVSTLSRRRFCMV